MRLRFLTVPVFLFSLILMLSDSRSGLGQFRGGPPGGPGGFGGGGSSMTFFMLTKDPQALFEKLSRGRDHFLISETFSLREPLTQFAKENNITDEKISRDHFSNFAEKIKTKLAAGTPSTPAAPSADGKTAAPASGTSSDMEAAMNLRIEFEFRRRDVNGDGMLNMEEMPDSLRSDLARWDKNGDNLIDMNEFRAYYQNRYMQKQDGSSSSGRGFGDSTVTVIIEEDDRRPVVYRAGKLPKELPAWFNELDKDRDGQVALAEWRKAGKSMAEFKSIDRNEDGLLTPEEVLRHQNNGTSTASQSTGSDIVVREVSRSEEKGGGTGGFPSFGKGKGKGNFGKGDTGGASRFKKPGQKGE